MFVNPETNPSYLVGSKCITKTVQPFFSIVQSTFT